MLHPLASDEIRLCMSATYGKQSPSSNSSCRVQMALQGSAAANGVESGKIQHICWDYTLNIPYVKTHLCIRRLRVFTRIQCTVSGDGGAGAEFCTVRYNTIQ